jgi:selenocysteine-specific elongation factor
VIPEAGSGRAPLTLGTAGHIDHGKTVLVEALTGVKTDRLPEERERGISIELGFASLELPSGRPLSVVDVPGHERFVRTMVAGATGIDLFLLVVAADDGVMPQTREHLAVLETLGVPAGVVALTKTDVAGAEALELVAEEVRELLAGGPYEHSPVTPVCAPAGEGIGDVVAALDEVASGLSPDRAPAEGEARLHVDRSFVLKGVGTVVTGTLWSGTLGAGDEVRIEPSGRTARVRGIEVHGRARSRAEAGQRVALNLAGRSRGEVERGDVVTALAAGLRPTYLVDAAVELRPGAGTFRRGARVHFHHGTRETPARMSPVEGEVLKPGRRSYVQLRLERPVVPTAGDRFVLRQVAPPDTIGGGVILDPAPRKHGPGREHVERLRLLESGDALERLEAQLDGSPSGLGEVEIDPDLLERLRADGHARRVGKRRHRYFAPDQLERARSRLLVALEEVGSGRPLSRGALADAAGLSDLAAASVLEELVAEGNVLARGPGFAPAGTGRLEDPRAERLLDALLADGLEPRGAGALGAALGMTGEQARELLEELALEGRVAPVKPGIYYHPNGVADAERRVVAICRRDGSVTIARLRDELGTSRKYAQALLEYFDAQRLTRRDGDAHVLRRRPGGRSA